ncbi:MAG: hypothetical protein ACREUM_08475, partial [Nitrosospira sp.]
NTVNVDDPVAAADFVSIGSFNFTFNVFEGSTASVDILATLSTGLTATPSGAVPSGAEIFSPGPLDPSPNYTLTFAGFSNPSSGGFVSVIPEPFPFILFSFGLVVLWIARRRAYLQNL